jgi:hypothetical protein
MNEDTALNPICLLSRTDTPTFSLYHSFFLLSVDIHDNKLSEVIFRVPTRRDRLDDIETAVKYFAVNVSGKGEDMFGSFVLTTSDGSRFYALWRGSPFLLFIAISIFPLLTFTRNLFMLLAEEPPPALKPLLNTLCEFPILGCASLRYEVRLSGGSLPLHFNELGLVDDSDINLVAVQAFTPQMLVESWEALILENKVLVICSNASIVPYCCEFLRRLILPLILINTFVPFLPEELLSTIEAPFPYLVGAQSESVFANRIDLSDTFVIDIDAQCVRYPRGTEKEAHAPVSMKAKAVQEINALCFRPLAQWVCRAVESRQETPSQAQGQGTASHPSSPETLKRCGDGILKLFVQMNLSLLAARYCDVRAFYRRCDRPFACTGSRSREPFQLPKHKGPDGKVSAMGFSYRSGVVCGCMQLLNERKDIDVLQFLPCWVEMDHLVFAVYEFADELPLIFFLKRDIVSVSPSPAEPEGHVFDIQIGSQISYRFAATDPDSRRDWLKEIEKASSSSSSSHRHPSHPLSSSVPFTPPNSPTQPQTPGHMLHQPSSSAFSSSGGDYDFLLHDSDDPNSSSHHDLDEESDTLARFRAKVVQTQMVSFYKTRSEFPEYAGMLSEQDLTHEDLTTGHPDLSRERGSEAAQDRSCSQDGHETAGEEDTTEAHTLRTKPNHSDADTTICSEPVILNLQKIWGLYVSGELVSNKSPYDVSYAGNKERSNNKRKGVSIRKSALNTESVSWLVQSPISQAASMTFLSKEPRDYRALAQLHKAAMEADTSDQKSSRESSSWPSFLKFKSSSEAVSHTLCSAPSLSVSLFLCLFPSLLPSLSPDRTRR